MRVNENTAIIGDRVILVPYRQVYLESMPVQSPPNLIVIPIHRKRREHVEVRNLRSVPGSLRFGCSHFLW